MIQKENEKYTEAPTKKLIDKIIKASGFTCADFERFFGIPEKILMFHRCGIRPLPKKYWHLFFDPPEKIKERVNEYDIARERARQSIHHRKRKPIVVTFPEVHEKKIKVEKIGVLADLLRR